jgi:hypothetical protein
MYSVPKTIPVGWKELSIGAQFKTSDLCWNDWINRWENRRGNSFYQGPKFNWFTIRKIKRIKFDSDLEPNWQ